MYRTQAELAAALQLSDRGVRRLLTRKDWPDTVPTLPGWTAAHAAELQRWRRGFRRPDTGVNRERRRAEAVAEDNAARFRREFPVKVRHSIWTYRLAAALHKARHDLREGIASTPDWVMDEWLRAHPGWTEAAPLPPANELMPLVVRRLGELLQADNDAAAAFAEAYPEPEYIGPHGEAATDDESGADAEADE